MDQPLNDPESNKQEEHQTELDIQRQRLELDKSRLASEIADRESRKAQDDKRFALEKSKDRTARWQLPLQMVLTFLFSLAAIAFNSCNEDRRSKQAESLQKMQLDLQYNQAVSSYNDGRIELFRKMTERASNGDEILKVYKEVFPRDSIILRNEQRDVAGK